MADTSAGGWVRNAFRSAASTRPWASASGACCAGSGAAWESTRSSASATDSNATCLLPRAIMAAAAATFFDEPDALDPHAALERFHHVVDGQAGDRDCGQCLHLDPGRSGDLHPRLHLDAGQLGVGLDVHLD